MPQAEPSLPPVNPDALVREILTRVADKWTLLVITTLEEEGELRFSRLREQVGGISQKMLTKTLRDLWLWVEAHMQDVLRSRGSYDSGRQ